MTVALMRLHLGGELALCPRSLAAVLAEHPGVGRVWVRTVRWPDDGPADRPLLSIRQHPNGRKIVPDRINRLERSEARSALTLTRLSTQACEEAEMRFRFNTPEVCPRTRFEKKVSRREDCLPSVRRGWRR